MLLTGPQTASWWQRLQPTGDMSTLVDLEVKGFLPYHHSLVAVRLPSPREYGANSCLAHTDDPVGVDGLSHRLARAERPEVVVCISGVVAPAGPVVPGLHVHSERGSLP